MQKIFRAARITSCSPSACADRSSRAQIVRAMASVGEWQRNLVTDAAEIRSIANSAKTVAVLGCKTEKQADQPAFFVAEYLQSVGVRVIPVPVFYPEVTEILGQQVYRKVADIPEPLDILDVFRKPSDIPAHMEDILAAKPKCVWLQTGIRAPEVEEQLARAGILVVANACLKVERGGGHQSKL